MLVWAVSQTSSVIIKLAWQLLKLPWHVLNPHLAPYQVRWGSSKILLGRIQANLPCHYKILIIIFWGQKKKAMGGPRDGQWWVASQGKSNSNSYNERKSSCFFQGWLIPQCLGWFLELVQPDAAVLLSGHRFWSNGKNIRLGSEMVSKVVETLDWFLSILSGSPLFPQIAVLDVWVHYPWW